MPGGMRKPKTVRDILKSMGLAAGMAGSLGACSERLLPPSGPHDANNPPPIGRPDAGDVGSPEIANLPDVPARNPDVGNPPWCCGAEPPDAGPDLPTADADGEDGGPFDIGNF